MTKRNIGSEAMPAPPPFHRRLFVGGALLIALLVVLLSGFLLHRNYLFTEQLAAARTQNLARVLEGELGQTIGKSEIVLRAVAEEYRRQLAAGQLDDDALTAFMKRRREHAPEIDSLQTADAQGMLRHGAADTPAGTMVNVADREYFLHCRDNPGAGLHIAKPVMARDTGQWVQPLVLRLDRPDNSFGGVVVVGLSLEHITRMLATIDAGEQGVVALFDASPAIIARAPEPDGPGSAVGKRPSSPDLENLLASKAPMATYRARSAIDGIERTFTIRKVGGHPLYLSVGLAPMDYLAGWRQELLATTGFITIFVSMLFTASMLSSRYWKAQEDALRALRKSEDDLKSANIGLAALWSISTLTDATIRTVANHILASITRISGSLYGFYGFLDEDESALIVHSWSGSAMEDCAMTDSPSRFPIAGAGVWAEVVRRREPIILNDYAAPHPAKRGLPPGHVRITNLLVTPTLANGKVTAVAAVANRAEAYGQDDVTRLCSFLTSVQVVLDSNRARAALRESEEKYRQLFEALREKTAQLEDLTVNLEKRVDEEIAIRTENERILVQQAKLAAMGEMLGTIAHQWRQPLNALGMIIQNIRDAHAFGELDTEYLDTSVSKSMLQIKHMSKTIEDFRNFFMPDKTITAFDPMRAVGDVLRLLSAQLATSAIDYRLTCHASGRIFTAEADILPCEKAVRGYRNEFEHVVMNLVNNARDAILEKRSGTPRKNPWQGLIAFDFRHDRKGLVLEISDNGGGIDTAILDRVFEPYFTTKDPSKGTGLGLYMSKVIMEHMNGTLDVRNGDQGAIFTLKLPGT